MKKLFTIKFSMIDIWNISRIRGSRIIIEGREEKRKIKRRMEALMLIPIIGAIGIYINPSKKLALGVSIITMLEAIRIQITMDKEVGGYQKVMSIGWGNQEIGFGMDGISINFVVLTAILIPICILLS